MKYLSLDIRALALMRMAIACVIMLDLCIRSTDLEAFYSNTGAVPLALIFDYAWNDYYISVHTISGQWQVQAFLFALSFFFAIMLFIGYRTRLFTILCWFMMLSLHNRNEFILQGGDDLLRMVLFWGMFLPWGRRYSCDSLRTATEAGTGWRDWAGFAYILQIAYVYTGSALLKGPEWHTDFTALYYVYSLDQISYPLASYIYGCPELMKVLTAIAYYFELLVPVLFFIPVKHEWSRVAGVILIWGFHLFNGLTVFIGLFFIIGIVTAIGLLPSFIMDRLEAATVSIRRKVADSFRGIAYAVSYFISWKPVRKAPVWRQRLNTTVLIFLTCYVLYWNLSNVSFVRYKMGDSIRSIAYSLRIDQCWGMFAPNVFKDDGWYVLEAETEQGHRFDLLKPFDSLHYRKPASVLRLFKNDRWRKYSENCILAANDFLRGYFCNYCKRSWNEAHPERKIRGLRIIYMSEFSLPAYRYSPPEQCILFECN